MAAPRKDMSKNNSNSNFQSLLEAKFDLEDLKEKVTLAKGDVSVLLHATKMDVKTTIMLIELFKDNNIQLCFDIKDSNGKLAENCTFSHDLQSYLKTQRVIQQLNESKDEHKSPGLFKTTYSKAEQLNAAVALSKVIKNHALLQQAVHWEGLKHQHPVFTSKGELKNIFEAHKNSVHARFSCRPH